MNLELIPALRDQIIATQRNDKGIAHIKRRLKDGYHKRSPGGLLVTRSNDKGSNSRPKWRHRFGQSLAISDGSSLPLVSNIGTMVLRLAQVKHD